MDPREVKESDRVLEHLQHVEDLITRGMLRDYAALLRTLESAEPRIEG